MNFADSDATDLEMYPMQLNRDSLGPLELDALPYFEWKKTEKYTANFLSLKQNAFKISIKTTESTNIPVKFEILRPKADQPFRFYASITNNFTTQVIFSQTDIILGKNTSKVTLKLKIKPRQIVDEGWLIENFLYVQIYVFQLNETAKITKKAATKKRSRKTDDDAEFENPEVFSSRSYTVNPLTDNIVSSRSLAQRVARNQRIDQLLQDNITMIDNGEVASGYCGIKNLGATCYMNSFLQVLYHIPLFRKVFFSIDTEHDDGTKSVILNMQRLFGLMQMSSEPVNTEPLTISFGWNEADSNQQHDVEEFRIVLMDVIKDKIMGTEQAQEVKKLFTGQMVEVFNFPKAGVTNTKDDTFDDIQIVVNGCKDIYESLDRFVEEQPITGYNLEGYGKQNGVRKAYFAHLPDVIFFHLQRFELSNGKLIKINSKFQFPVKINLERYMTTAARSNETSDFTLTGIIVHSGNPIGGHYYSYIRTQNDDQWYLFNDSSVTISNEEKAVNNNFGGSCTANDGPLYGKMKTYSAYMLVYVRTSELENIFTPITIDCIPKHIIDYVKQELQEQKERIAMGITTRFNLYDERSVVNNIEHANQPLQNAKDPLVVGVPMNATNNDLYKEVSSLMNCEVGSFRLWTVAQPQIIAPITNNANQFVKNIQTSDLFFEKVPPLINFSSSLMFFLVYYDKTNSKAPFKYIRMCTVNIMESPLSLLHQVFGNYSSFNIQNDTFMIFGQKKPNTLSLIKPNSSFSELALMNASFIILQTADCAPLENLIPDLSPTFYTQYSNHSAQVTTDISSPQTSNEHNEEVIWYYDVFPDEIPQTADITYLSYSDTFLFTVIPKKETDIIRKCRAPATLSFVNLKKFIAVIIGKHYDPEDDYAFLYRTTEHIPISDDSNTIKASFKKSPEENIISMIVINKSLCPDGERNIRLIIDFSEDSIHISKRIIRAFFLNDTFGDVEVYFRNKYQIPPNLDIRCVNVKDSKIRKTYFQEDEVTEVENPVRLDIVPAEQSHRNPHDIVVRVSFIGKDFADTKKCCGIPFFFLIKNKEPFFETKQRLLEATNADPEEFKKFTFRVKQVGSYGVHYVKDDTVLADQLSDNDRLYIVLPGGQEVILKRRSSPVSTSLKINH